MSHFMVQGGDIICNNGTSGESIYGRRFEDENFILPHSTGALSMANEGKPNTNSSQFFVATVPCSHLDGKNVVFGRVLKGIGILKEIDKCEQRDRNMLVEDCIVHGCGELLPGDDFNICDNDGTPDTLPPYPEDYEFVKELQFNYEEKIMAIKNSGNIFFSRGYYKTSDRKYKKALRYIHYVSSKYCEKSFFFDDDYLGPIIPELLDIKLLCLINLAATFIKLKEYREVIVVCNQVLSYDPGNVKAKFRRGKANMQLNNYSAGLNDLIEAKKLCPSDLAICKELRRSKRLNSEYRKYEKCIFKKMILT